MTPNLSDITAVKDLYSYFSELTSYPDFVINMALTVALSAILAKVYVWYGRSLSNKHSLANNFVFLAITIMFVISVVKSSLALSLGLVGALSIVRFRTPIKEPEELIYLFICIAIGLGLGANQRAMTVTAFMILLLVILYYAARKFDTARLHSHHIVNATFSGVDRKTIIAKISGILAENCESVLFKRFAYEGEESSIVFTVMIENIDKLSEIINEIDNIDGLLEATIVEYEGLV